MFPDTKTERISNRSQSSKAAPTPRAFQADVHQHCFGSLSLGHAYVLFRTCCNADHLEPSRGELVLQVERDQDFIFHDENSASGLSLLAQRGPR